ncbi:hypothetical protein CSUB01_00429 [Colletotrichum sublineola]|uniref:Uncharacterized protein n=1 Tax=Colletotrichum sublineola TaxID=1173701 RepID=A0A066X679_COLSU|nr:hypothetical protein CSUB01_00429 [Colletotrichum sublineola]
MHDIRPFLESWAERERKQVSIGLLSDEDERPDGLRAPYVGSPRGKGSPPRIVEGLDPGLLLLGLLDCGEEKEAAGAGAATRQWLCPVRELRQRHLRPREADFLALTVMY